MENLPPNKRDNIMEISGGRVVILHCVEDFSPSIDFILAGGRIVRIDSKQIMSRGVSLGPCLLHLRFSKTATKIHVGRPLVRSVDSVILDYPNKRVYGHFATLQIRFMGNRNM